MCLIYAVCVDHTCVDAVCTCTCIILCIGGQGIRWSGCTWLNSQRLGGKVGWWLGGRLCLGLRVG